MRGKVRVPEIPRRGEGCGDMRARNKIEFRKGGGGEEGVGRVKETTLPRVSLLSCSLDVSISFSVPPLFCSRPPSLVFLFLRSRNIRPDEIRFRGKSACPKSIATTSHYKGRPRKMAFEILREWWNCVSQRERDGNR